MKNILYRALGYAGIARVLQFFDIDIHMMVLAYHRVSPVCPENGILRDMVVTPEDFEEQIVYLKERYAIVSLEDALAHISSGLPRKRLVVITFDDAYRDNYEHAYAILKRHHIPATIFVATGFIETKQNFFWDELAEILSVTLTDSFLFVHDEKSYNLSIKNFSEKQRAFSFLCLMMKNMDMKGQKILLQNIEKSLGVDQGILDKSKTMTWAQMREMKGNNISFGAHTHSHHPVSTQTTRDFQNDVLRSKNILDEKLSQSTTLFAYPFGDRRGIAPEHVAALRSCGFHCALTMEQGGVRMGDDRYLLKRIGIGGYDDKQTFKLKIAGAIPFFNRLKSKVYAN